MYFGRYERYALSMGLTKQYLRAGQSAKNRLFGIPPVRRGPSLGRHGPSRGGDRTPLQMLVSEQGNISQGRLAVIILGVVALTLGILMSTIPWVDWLILKQLRLWNGTLSYYYWKQPGVMRLTKVFVFNMTNVDAFLNHGQKPKLEEVGPFVYRIKNNVKKEKPKTSTPVKEGTIEPDINISHVSSVSNVSSKLGKDASSSNSEKENLHDEPLGKTNLNELKAVMFQRSHLFQQHKESLEEIHRQITDLREKLEQEKKEVYATINAFKEISAVERRCQVEAANDALASDSDMQLEQYFSQLMTAVNHERNKLELKNISFFSDEQCKKLLREADASIKSFHDSGEFEAVEKLASFLPALEESIEKCNASNEKCAEITESIKRLLLHRKTLRAIEDTNKSST